MIKQIAVAILAAVLASAMSQAQPDANSDKAALIGAWHLANIKGPDGNATSNAPLGMLIYTADGHMSVQLMYPKAASVMSNQYVQNGYEASFGSYDVDEAKHTVTHHVQGSNTRDLLVGKDLARVYSFSSENHLIIRSASPDEHWAVTWERY